MTKQKIRVLRIANRLNIGGPTYNVCYLTKFLGVDFETLLIAGQEDTSEGSSLYVAQEMGLEPKIIPSMKRSIHPIRDRRAYKEVRKVIRDFKPHIVHTHAAKAGAIGRYAAYKEGVPLIIHTYHGHVFHSYFSSLKTKVFLAIERYLGKKSHGLIAISPLQKKELSKTFKVAPASKFEIVSLGFNLDRFFINMDVKRAAFRNEWLIRDETLAIGVVGRLVPIKNHELFLHGFVRAKKNITKNVQVYFIGDGEARQSLMSLCAKLGLTLSSDPCLHSDIIFTSWIADVDRALAGLDLVCLTSKNEGTPVSLIEASCAGKPFISTNVGGIRDIVSDPSQGLVLEDNSISSFEKALAKAVNHSNPGETVPMDVRKNVAERFGYKQLCSSMSEVYYRLLST